MFKKKAQSLIEYALILALVTIIAITVLSMLSKKIDDSENDYQDNQKIETNANR